MASLVRRATSASACSRTSVNCWRFTESCSFSCGTLPLFRAGGGKLLFDLAYALRKVGIHAVDARKGGFRAAPAFFKSSQLGRNLRRLLLCVFASETQLFDRPLQLVKAGFGSFDVVPPAVEPLRAFAR